MENCPDCKGTGAKNPSDATTCPVCNGSGEVSHTQNTAFGRFVNVPRVTDVMEKEPSLSDPCPKCHGRKKIRRVRKISVTIPAGIDNNQAITLRGEGQTGESWAAQPVIFM
jgi:molecular chaperone DnaJ